MLRTLDGNERWNLDMSSGEGRTDSGRKKILMPKEFTVIDAYLGDYSEQVPANYFDMVFSISVMEHIPPERIPDFFSDHYRTLKSGGIGLHAVDFYLGDSRLDNVEKRLDSYCDSIEDAGLQLISPTTLKRPLVFETEYASNPDLTMRHWNQLVPKLRSSRETLQSVSLALGVIKK